MKLGATKKTRNRRKTLAGQLPEKTRTTTWIDDWLATSSAMDSSLAGLGLNWNQRDRLVQEISGQLRSGRQVRPGSAAALCAAIDVPRLSGKVGVPLNVARSALAILAQKLEGAP